MYQLTEWIRTHLNTFFAIAAALAILTFTILNPGWWGDRALGVLIGVVSLSILLPVLILALERTKLTVDKIVPWILVIVPTATALIVRRMGGYRLIWPIQFHTPTIPQPQSLLLILLAIFMLMLLIVFVRALHRGEGVAIENHWGGLGGGVGGVQLSTPLIYLLGIVFLLVVSSALAWRIFPPPQSQQSPSSASQQPAQTSSATSSPTAALPNGTASPIPNNR